MRPFSTQFTLSKRYLAECYDQSLPYGKNPKPNYIFPACLFVAGTGLLLFVAEAKLIGIMLVALGGLELVHIRFRRAWWLTRQMWGRSSGSEVELSIDEEGIKTQNPYTQTALKWADVERVIETELGLILVAKSGGQQYLSKALFSDELIKEIIALNPT